jgi:hypothetical protein
MDNSQQQLPQLPQQPQQDTYQAPPLPPEGAYLPPVGPVQPMPRRHHHWLLWGSILLLIIVVAAIAAWWFLRKSSSPDVAFSLPSTNYTIPSNAVFLAPSGVDTASGAQSSPVKTLSAAISKAPAGGTVVVRGGEYHDVSLGTINKKVAIQAYPHETVWIKGSAVVSGWKQDGTTWRHDGWATQFCQTCVNSQAVDPNYPNAGKPDQVFINNQPLNQVASKAQVGPGKFYVDYASKAMYVGTNPGTSTVEASTQWKALQLNSGAAGSSIRGIGFAQYAPHWNEDQLAAVYSVAENVTFENDAFVQSAGNALGIYAANNKVINSNISYNGYRGFGANKANNLVLTGNTIDNNNTEHFAASGCGAYCTVAGAKIAHTENLTITDNNFRNNAGHGFWCDLGCINTTFVRNVATGNQNAGVFYEVSSKALIGSNIIAQNGSGVRISSSDHVRVYNNTLSRNATNITLYTDGRSPTTDSWSNSKGLSWKPTNTEIRNNIFSNNNGSTGVFFDTNYRLGISAKVAITAMDHNAWYRTNSNTPSKMFYWCETSSCVSYKSVAEFSKATGLDASSIAVDNQATNPFFTNESVGNYALTGVSKANKAGATLPSDIATTIGVPTTGANLGALKWPNQSSSDSGTTSSSKDEAKPIVSLTSPVKDAKLSGVTTLLASASDNDKIAKVEFYVDNQLVATASTTPYMASWGTSSIIDGSHTITAKAYDASGNVGISDSTAITTDNLIKTGTVFTYDNKDIKKSSGMTEHGNVFFTHNDSGDPARFFALDGRNGQTFGTYTVPGGAITDWEDMSRGIDDKGNPALFIGDIGDNTVKRSEISVIRVSEPQIDQTKHDVTGSAQNVTRWRLKYPDGSHDAKAMLVQPGTNRIFIITKDVNGAAIYQVPSDPSKTDVTTLVKVGAVDEPQATGASFSSTGDRFVVRGYQDAVMYTVVDGDIATALTTTPLRFTTPSQPQGESIAFGPGDTTLVMSSQQPDFRVLSMRAPSGSGSSSVPGTSSSSPTSSPTSNPGDSTTDKTGPTLTLVSPTSDSSVAGKVYISANASDPSGVKNVTFKVNNSIIVTDTDAPYVAVWDSTRVSDGAYTLSAVAQDNKGNTTTSSVKVTSHNTVASNNISAGAINLTFTPSDNATMYQSPSNVNYKTQLNVDSNPRRDFVLKFTVAGVGSRKVTGSKLVLYGVDPGPAGTQFFQAQNNNWSQNTVVWSNAPAAIGSPFATLGTIAAGQLYTVDLGSIVKGDGTYSVRVSSQHDDGVGFDSIQGSVKPQVIVTAQ